VYSVSENYKKAIREKTRKLDWYGTATTKDGVVYPFTSVDILKGSGSVTRSSAGGTALELGSVYASEINITLLKDIDRYTLYDGIIDLFFRPHLGTIITWDDASEFTWDQLSNSTWDDPDAMEDIPMGIFTISEVTRKAKAIQIKAYDFMLKFDTAFSDIDTEERLPYDWLQLICDRCGVSFGMTRGEFYTYANGLRMLSFAAGTDDSIKTYRDLISAIATALCMVAQIDRCGELVLLPFGMAAIASVPASWRFDSSFADYETHYSGLYATYKKDALTEYTHVSDDSGLAYDIGTNPFLQIATVENRTAALQKLIDRISEVTYTPFQVTVPSDPALDPMDVLSFEGGQAVAGKVACITSITYRINGKMDLQCVGENPRLSDAKTRYTKNIEGLIEQNADIGSTEFWIVSDKNTEGALSIGSTAVMANELEFQISAITKGAIFETANYTLDKAAIVQAVILLDGKILFATKDYHLAGEHVLSLHTPFDLEKDGEKHEVIVNLSCMDNEGSDYKTLDDLITGLTARIKVLEDKQSGGNDSTAG
jgi:hypothetical protein